MDWEAEALLALRALAAALLGAFIGRDREEHGREAGIRTYAVVSLGACVFGLVSVHVIGEGDPTRMARAWSPALAFSVPG